MPRTKQRTPELRDRVLEVAMETLAAGGPAAFTTRRVAREAATSTTAIYELFGDKNGVLRAMFFSGFRVLGDALSALPVTDDPRADVLAVVRAFRTFAVTRPQLAKLMFSLPFADFEPGDDELRAGSEVRELIVDRVRRGVDTGIWRGNATDIAHVLLALAQGLAGQEGAGWLGTTSASRDRRWELAFRALLDGLSARGEPRRGIASRGPSRSKRGG